MRQREVVIEFRCANRFYFGWHRHERQKTFRDPQDVLIDADLLPQRM